MKLNLHTHTNHSIDSHINVADFLKVFSDADFDLLSITDHNSVDAYYDIMDKNLLKNFKGDILIGCELDVRLGDLNFDATCYGFDLGKMKKMLDENYGPISRQTLSIYDEFCDVAKKRGFEIDKDYEFDPEKLYAYGAMYENLMKSEKNKKKLQNVMPKTYGEFYRLSTTDPKFPLFYTPKANRMDLLDVLKFVHSIGGKVYLAHPYSYYSDDFSKTLLEQTQGLVDGIEVFNAKNSAEQVKHLKEIIKENNIDMSAGTDYHYPNRQILNVTQMQEEDAVQIARSFEGMIEKSNKILSRKRDN